VVEAVEDAPGEAMPELEEGVTNGDDPAVRLRGAYAEGTVTTILSRSKEIMRTYKPEVGIKRSHRRTNGLHQRDW
jgi:hypothetical protein